MGPWPTAPRITTKQIPNGRICGLFCRGISLHQWWARGPPYSLPSYSPELNPEERLNADLKHVIGRKVPVRTKAKLRAAAEQHMEVIGSEPERVKAYFRDPRVNYAA